MKFSFKSFVIGFLCALLGLGTVTYVNASSDSTIKACANKKTGAMRYISKGSCKKTETSLSWNHMGSQGLSGERGPAGVNGTAGAKGDTGANGAKGDTGANGAKGDTGANGANTNSQVKNICGTNGTTACAVGLKGPGGGIVFMTPSTLGNTSGLFYEAAPSTWSSPSGDPRSTWCNNNLDLLGVASTAAGNGAMDGAARTTLMVGACTSGAAVLADAYIATVNGVEYGDWFLPSKGELNQMYVNRAVVGGFFTIDELYWSSSEYSASIAWGQSFFNGVQWNPNFNKDSNYRVRPVRAF